MAEQRYSENEGQKRTAKGRVYLVGAGPGDIGLLTLKGKQALEEAETVIYDALISVEILSLIPGSARQIYVGKRGGNHAKSQEQIGQILLDEAKKGRRVVRLKGGDPFVFGRGGEEAELLKAHRVPFEVIPGITSAIAAPAYGGIPVTHRGLSSSFHVITGHGKNGEPVKIDYEALTRLNGTLIFLMGVASAQAICDGLIEAGMDPHMPAAFLQQGTTANQKKVISPLCNLTHEGKRAGIAPPAVLIVGEVCRMETVCRWAEEKPLFGKRALVTRPRKRSSQMVEKLRKAGAEVVELSVIEPLLIESNKALEKAVETINQYQWLAFTSPSGAELFLEYMKNKKKDIRSLSGIKIAVIGRGTGEILEQSGLYADYMPERFYAADLGKGLSFVINKGEKLLILRAMEASEELLTPLEEKNISYKEIPLYKTSYPVVHAQASRVKEQLSKGEYDFVTFTSGSTVEGFIKAMQPSGQALSGFTAVCIGEQTEKSAKAHGMNCIVSQIPSIDSMIEAMVNKKVGFPFPKAPVSP